MTSCQGLQDLEVIVTGDSFGKVKLFKYPATSGQSICQIYSGHSSDVSNVKFSGNRHFAVSIGGSDRIVLVCIFSYIISYIKN